MKIPTQKAQICVGIFFATLYIFTKTHFFYFIRKLFSFCAKSNSGFDEKLISNFEIKPLNAKKTVVYHYKNYIECSLGSFSINADKSVINYLLKSGIGSRKSAGFGFAELLSEGGEPN